MSDPVEPSAVETPVVDRAAGEAAAASPAALAGPVVARAGRYYRNARYIMVAVGIAMGVYFLYDGYVGYPKRNALIETVERELDATPKQTPRWYELEALQRKLGSPKSGTDIALQRVLGYVLPAAALAYLAYMLNKSRGEIRLDGDVLTVPGHPPVPLAAVQSVDARLWKKKGIATVKYAVDGKAGTLTLDDFVYQQTPIDAIYDRLVEVKTPPDNARAAKTKEDAPA